MPINRRDSEQEGVHHDYITSMTPQKVKKMKPMSKDHKLFKFYAQRYLLFSRFDDGIQLDDVSWYSVTPESIAKHIAERVFQSVGPEGAVIVDGFVGVGGNMIQFACQSPSIRVIGCDIDEGRLRMAKHNAKIYGVQHQCEFILGDFMKVMPALRSQKIDAVFLSPPWGGVDYIHFGKYSLNFMTPNGYDIMQVCRKYLTKNVAFLMPRNVDLKEVAKKLLDTQNQTFEYEKNMVGKKTKTVTVYFGNLADDSCETDTEPESVTLEPEQW